MVTDSYLHTSCELVLECKQILILLSLELSTDEVKISSAIYAIYDREIVARGPKNYIDVP